MVQSIKLIIFFLSTIGYWELFRRRTSMNRLFIPSFTICAQTLLLILCGLLNCLDIVSLGMYVIGLFLLIKYFIIDRSVSLFQSYFDLPFIYLFFCTVIIIFSVKGVLFWQYDNFSHWGLVVKEMLLTDRLPNFSDSVIMFSDYPLGSACYIYFFSRFIKLNSDSVMMLAQGYMTAAFLMPMFLFCKKNNAVRYNTFLPGLLFTNLMLVYNIRITEVLVDTLLPIVGMCGCIYVYDNKDHLDRFVCFTTSVYIAEMIQIKNSGIFFGFICLCMTMHYIKKQSGKLLFPRVLQTLCIPICLFFLWKRHCSYVFSSSATAKHALTLANFSKVFQAKSDEDVRLISNQLLIKTLQMKDIWAVLGLVLLSSLLLSILLKRKSVLFKILGWSVLVLAFYQVGMLGMYLFSMPNEEALRLACFDRYTKSVLIFLLYLSALLSLTFISKGEGNLRSFLFSFLVIAEVFCFQKICMGQIEWVIGNTSDNELRVWIENAKRDFQVPDEDSYTILIPAGTDKGFWFYLGRYVFHSSGLAGLSIDDPSQLEKVTTRYVFIRDSGNEIIKNWIAEKYPEQIGNPVIIQY